MKIHRLFRYALGLLLAGLLILTALSWRTSLGLRQRAWDLESGGLTSEALPPRWIEWLLAVEDPAFHSHRGIDLSTPGAGWTTLTQGLVKIHFRGPYRGLVGKPLQSLRALVLDAVVSKDQQLTLMLADANLGSHEGRAVRGFSDAAETYYDRSLTDLSDRQFLGLVAMLVGPNRFHPKRHPERHGERLRRLEALIEGRCAPGGWRDVYLPSCAAPAPAVGNSRSAH